MATDHPCVLRSSIRNLHGCHAARCTCLPLLRQIQEASLALKKALIQPALEGVLSHHLGYL
jgi:hypothetical protein